MTENKTKYLRFRVQAQGDTPLGRIISKVHELPQDTKATIVELLFLHFSAMVFTDDADKTLRQIAITNTQKLVGVARAAELLLGIEPNQRVMTAVAPTSNGNGSQDQEEEEEEEGIPINTSSEKLFGG